MTPLKHPGRICLMVLVLLCMLCAVSLADESRTITLKLSEETQQSGNKKYVKDKRTYDREMTAPVVNGIGPIKGPQLTEGISYICPIPVGSTEAVLHLPYSAAFTTIEVNGKLLSHGKDVEVPLGEDVPVRVATKNRRAVFYVYFTTLPVAVIDYKGSDLYANNVNGTMTLYDTDYAAHGQSEMAYTTKITVGYRGQSSLSYDKHNYSIHLKDESDGQSKVSLLGLRKDDDWVLSGAMNDQLRVRNMVAMQVWDEFYTLPWSKDSGAIEGEYCEVIMNGKYMGLFCLMEKLDRKQADLDKENGRIVRSVEAEKNGVNIMSFKNLGGNKPANRTTWYNMEIKFPKEDVVKKAHWNEFYDFVYFVAKSKDDKFAAEIGNYIDLDNFASYYVYITAIGATGNMNKNLYFIMEDATAEDAKWLVVPWDVDGSFGRRNNASKRDIEVLSSNQLFERLIKTNAQGFADLLREKWNENKNGLFSYDSLMARFDDYYQALDAEGVWEREQIKWPKFSKTYKFDAETEYKYIQDYMKARWDYVDSYFNGNDLSAKKWLQ
ncbi:MAG: CotH kinase family protein [Clostridia bacterium]|nr:CotH kinase family protein [Clostridia bacterium]